MTRQICEDCLRPEATPEQWANDHNDGYGCECAECVSVCWGDYAYCRSVADERLRKHDAEQPLLERYRTALEAIITGWPCACYPRPGECPTCIAREALL